MSFKEIDVLDNTRPLGKNCILVYGYDSESKIKIQDYKNTIGIDAMIEVKDEHLEEVVLNIIEDKLIVNQPAESIASKAIVFNAVSQFELNKFVKGFKELGLERPLFAMVTPTSGTWKFKDLLKELESEREALKN